MAIFALIAGYLDGQKHEKEIDDLNGRLDQQKDQLNEQKGMGLGIAAIIGRRLEGIESKITDPQSKAELSEIREESFVSQHWFTTASMTDPTNGEMGKHISMCI